MKKQAVRVIGYHEFFEAVVAPAEAGQEAADRALTPYRYQQLLAAEPWPEMLDVPTGLGKTAAVMGAWLYRRLIGDSAAPRRLVWCLPMRVLVEQTRTHAERWLERAAPMFEQRGLVPPRVYVVMGGEVEDEWVRRPEDPAVLVGTQDMLLSRALMRGYGASRYRWPIDFALLHSDALWVFDEVQLMGGGLPTSAQLEAFRRHPDMPAALPARTIWSSATLNRDWLATVDFRPHLPDARVLTLPEEDRRDPRVRKRFSAPKHLAPARARFDGTRKADIKACIDALSDEIITAHAGEAPTLVILNRVQRAQDVYTGVRKLLRNARRPTEVLLVHARFRAAERERLNVRLRGVSADEDLIIVATQAVEAGVDITSRRLFTELAPWPSLVQRFGRCNRGGEYESAEVRWVDIDVDADAQLALPYDSAALREAREQLQRLHSASSDKLPPVDARRESPHVLRRKDFLDLFNTEPDLSGFDIDVSPYLRDPGGADVQLFWRDYGDAPVDQPRPDRRELCPVAIGSARDHLKALKRHAHAWDTLEAKWRRTEPADVRPGQVLLLRSDAGGYDADLGFVSRFRAEVEPLAKAAKNRPCPESMDEDALVAGELVELTDHLLEARRQAAALAEVLPMARAEDEVIEAALWHDVGKAHPAFQTAILDHAGDAADPSRLWAKSPNPRGRLSYGFVVDGERQERHHFRHELASMLAWLQAGGGARSTSDSLDPNAEDLDSDLIAYLIAAHHGKVRLALRALPNENRPHDDRFYARGVWAGDELPPFSVNGFRVPPLTLRLDVMQIGEGEMGPSWSARTANLLARWGPFRLAWLETMVRLADWRASEMALPAATGVS